MNRLSEFTIDKPTRRQLVNFYAKQEVQEEDKKIALLKRRMGIHFNKNMDLKQLERLFAYKYIRGV